MKSLSTLIRLHKWKLNEEQRTLADLIGLSDDMRGQLGHIEQDLKTEGALVGESVDVARSYSAFLRSQLDRRRRIEASIAELGREIAVVEERVSSAFRQLKTYEISLERRHRNAALEQGRRDQSSLDEIALNMHRAGSEGGAL